MKLIFHRGEVKVLGTNVQMQMCLEQFAKENSKRPPVESDRSEIERNKLWEKLTARRTSLQS